MKRQKRYTEENEILKEIERCQRLGVENLKSAEDLEQVIEASKIKVAEFEALKKYNEARYLGEQIKAWRVDVKKKQKRATRYLEGRMESLKGVLARFRTRLLPIEGNTSEAVVE